MPLQFKIVWSGHGHYYDLHNYFENYQQLIFPWSLISLIFFIFIIYYRFSFLANR